jgi:hypothetical protein
MDSNDPPQFELEPALTIPEDSTLFLLLEEDSDAMVWIVDIHYSNGVVYRIPERLVGLVNE